MPGQTQANLFATVSLSAATKQHSQRIAVIGRWLRIATLKDEEWLEGEPISDPARFVSALRESGLDADIFAFADPIDGIPVDRGYQFEIDNAAVIQTADYNAWWERLPREVRRNTCRAARRGIEIRQAAFDDDFAAGIKAIYDETPVRQGRKFWHCAKDLATIKLENSTYLDRCEFLGAYYSGELVGFMKLVYVHAGPCFERAPDKYPTTALIAKAAEICHQRGLKYLNYGKFTYGGVASNLTEFKRHLCFEKREYRRYYVPLSMRGWFALKLGGHKGWLALLPPEFINHFLSIRTWWLKKTA